MKELEGKDVFISCGGIGLPPLRPAIYHILRNREKYGKVTLLYGARTPADLMYTNEFDDWRKANIDVQVTVTAAVEAGPDAWVWFRCGSTSSDLFPQNRRPDLRAGNHDPLRDL